MVVNTLLTTGQPYKNTRLIAGMLVRARDQQYEQAIVVSEACCLVKRGVLELQPGESHDEGQQRASSGAAGGSRVSLAGYHHGAEGPARALQRAQYPARRALRERGDAAAGFARKSRAAHHATVVGGRALGQQLLQLLQLPVAGRVEHFRLGRGGGAYYINPSHTPMALGRGGRASGSFSASWLIVWRPASRQVGSFQARPTPGSGGRGLRL